MHKIAQSLLEAGAIKLQSGDPFTWSSGLKSPINCDSRKAMSYPASSRQLICSELLRLVKDNFIVPDVIVGVAMGAIPWGAWVADQYKTKNGVGLPFAYVRSVVKEHKLLSLVDGKIRPGDKVVVVEDLVSTGRSSLRAVQALRILGADVLGMVAIFTYDFPQVAEDFSRARVPLFTATNYSELMEVAIEQGIFDDTEQRILDDWYKAPSSWGK